MTMAGNTLTAGRRGEALVTVLVSCCGQLEYTRYCAPSLVRGCRAPVELLFLDSDSLDGTAEYLEGFAAAAPVKVEVVRMPAEPPLTPGRKDELVSIRGEFVALCSNDIIVAPGWLDRLTALAASAADIGMVAPMSNETVPPLRVTSVGYHLELEATPVTTALDAVGRFARNWQQEHAGQAFEADRLGGGCVLLKRAVLQALGTFPTRTPLGTFDVHGLSQRVRGAGQRLVGCREVFVHSFGSRASEG